MILVLFKTYKKYLIRIDTLKRVRNIRCPLCNGYCRRKRTLRHEFKSWTGLIAIHKALIPLGKQLVNCKADWVLSPWQPVKEKANSDFKPVKPVTAYPGGVVCKYIYKENKIGIDTLSRLDGVMTNGLDCSQEVNEFELYESPYSPPPASELNNTPSVLV